MEGESMSEWKEVKLGDVILHSCSGGTPKSNVSEYYDGEIPWLNTKEIDFNRIYQTERNITQKGLDNSSAKWIDEKCVIIAMYGATAGKIAINMIPLTTNQACCNLKVDDRLADFRYIYYFLKKDFKFLASLANGGAQQNLNSQIIKDYVIKLPSLSIQKEISDLLWTIDAKIETNNKLNEKLEEMAQAIFKSWFVDFEPFKDKPFHETELGMIPEAWEVKRISENDFYISDFVSNGSFASLKQNVTLLDYPDYAYFIRNTDLKVGKFKVYVNKESYDFLSKSKLIGGEIIISNVGDVGSVFLCPKLEKPMTLGNNIIMIKPSNEIFKYYLFQYFSSPIGQYMIDGISGGSVQRKFNKTDFRAMKILIPSKNILMNYYNIIKPVFDFKEELGKENDRLASLRDTLLPRLMSGELIV